MPKLAAFALGFFNLHGDVNSSSKVKNACLNNIKTVYILYVGFEWDKIKNVENQRKHGISFETATALWGGVHLEAENIAYSEDGEKRNATMGLIGDEIYVAIWTMRGENIRLISVRRARKNEEKIFFEKIQDRK